MEVHSSPHLNNLTLWPSVILLVPKTRPDCLSSLRLPRGFQGHCSNPSTSLIILCGVSRLDVREIASNPLVDHLDSN